MNSLTFSLSSVEGHVHVLTRELGSVFNDPLYTLSAKTCKRLASILDIKFGKKTNFLHEVWSNNSDYSNDGYSDEFSFR